MRTYKNPFLLENQWSEQELGDPFLMRFNGYYYLYCSSAGNYIKAWRSEDLVNYTYLGSVCDEPEIEGAYAPEVCYFKGKFYMITSPKGSGHYLLKSDRPEGPFHLISRNYGLMIDGSFFIDDDGSQYMLRAGHHGIVAHRMPEADTIDVNGSTIPESYLNYWTEGPMIIKRKGLYYLTYTGNHLHSKGYRVAYSISAKAPDQGYVNLRDNTLLLETGDEFHALGHSSSFLAPDLDSYYIAYHSFKLDANPRGRGMNIDRLFFNGARMYANPIWWEQEQPAMPDFYQWGSDGLRDIMLGKQQYYFTPVSTEEHYTAELSVNTNGDSLSLLYGYEGASYGEIILNKNGSFAIYEMGETRAEGRINDAVSFGYYITIRIARDNRGLMEIYLNNLLLASYNTVLGKGAIGIRKQDKLEIGFLGISAMVGGSGDKLAAKAIPGKFDAVHCKEEVSRYSLHDKGFEISAARLKAGDQLTFRVNVKEEGLYRIYTRVIFHKQWIDLDLSCGGRKASLHYQTSQTLEDGIFQTVEAGVVSLTAGIQDLSVTVLTDDLILDTLQFIKYAQVSDQNVVSDGRLTTDHIRIFGHKGFKSMISKYSGFTCAENFGRAFLGEEGWSDYRVLALVNRNTKATGDVSVYLRASRASWFPHQVTASLFGYRFKITVEGIYLYRCSYGEELIGYYAFYHEQQTRTKLEFLAEGSRITLFLQGEAVLTHYDPQAYLYGKVGLEANGEGFGFEEFNIRSLSD